MQEDRLNDLPLATPEDGPEQGDAAVYYRSPVTKRLREEMAAQMADRWEDGAVVRFRWGTYTYVALYIRGTDRWYLSGNTERGTFPRMIDGDKLVEKLLDEACEEIEVAIGWEAV